MISFLLAPFSLLMAEEIEEIKVTGSYIGTRANDIGTEIIDQSDFNDLNISTLSIREDKLSLAHHPMKAKGISM